MKREISYTTATTKQKEKAKRGIIMLLRRSVSVLNARLTDAPNLLNSEVFASVMVPRGRLVAMKHVQILLRKEEFALVMVPRGRFAAVKDVQILL